MLGLRPFVGSLILFIAGITDASAQTCAQLQEEYQARRNALISGTGAGFDAANAARMNQLQALLPNCRDSSPQIQQPQHNDTVNCGGYHCPKGTHCASSHRACLNQQDTDCGGYHCGPGQKCGTRRSCLPQTAVDCGPNSKVYCPAGSKCSLDGKQCLAEEKVDSPNSFDPKNFSLTSPNSIVHKNSPYSAGNKAESNGAPDKAAAEKRRKIEEAAQKERERQAASKAAAEKTEADKQDALVKRLIYPKSPAFASQNPGRNGTGGSTVAVLSRTPQASISKEAQDRRDAAIQRISASVGVNDIRDPREIAKLSVAQAVRTLSPGFYKGVKDLQGVANDAVALEKARREGRYSQEAQRVLSDNGVKLAEMILKEKGITGIDVGKLKDVAQLGRDSNTYLQQLIRQYDSAKAKTIAYNDLAISADRTRAALQRKRDARTPEEVKLASAAFEKVTADLVLKKRAADLAESRDKSTRSDPTQMITDAGKLTEKVIEPHLGPLAKTALTVSKEAANDLTTIAFKIETTNAVTRADTNLANSIQAALDAKKIIHNSSRGHQRVAAEAKFETAMKRVRLTQQEAEATRAVNYVTRVLPEDSVVGTVADIVAPQRMIKYERNEE
jgi:hypothetical protein